MRNPDPDPAAQRDASRSATGDRLGEPPGDPLGEPGDPLAAPPGDRRGAAAARRTVVWGYALLAVVVPTGLTLEALHALKVDVYLGSAVRREMWTLAHAHGGMLGILCLVHGCLAPRLLSVRDGARVAAPLRWAAVLMPLGFFAGGVLDHEGDPSLGILLVPCGGILLLVALLRAGFASAKVAAS